MHKTCVTSQPLTDKSTPEVNTVNSVKSYTTNHVKQSHQSKAHSLALRPKSANMQAFRLSFEESADSAENRKHELYHADDSISQTCQSSSKRRQDSGLKLNTSSLHKPAVPESPRNMKNHKEVMLLPNSTRGEDTEKIVSSMHQTQTVGNHERMLPCNHQTETTDINKMLPTNHHTHPSETPVAPALTSVLAPSTDIELKLCLRDEASYPEPSHSRRHSHKDPHFELPNHKTGPSDASETSEYHMTDSQCVETCQTMHFHNRDSQNYPNLEAGLARVEEETAGPRGRNSSRLPSVREARRSLACTEEHPSVDEDRKKLLHQVTSPSAPPINGVYQYHIFFSHCPEDLKWVEEVVGRLEAPPLNYTCAYTSPEDEDHPASLQKNILCAAMLSERVVLVVSRSYVERTWPAFEKTLQKLAQLSLHSQRILAVLMEDCELPESMGNLYFLNPADPEFFHTFTKRLKTGVTNGQVLTQCRLHVKMGWRSHLVPRDAELEMPPSLTTNGIGMEKIEFQEIISKVSGIRSSSNQLPWILSAQPLAILLLTGGLWLPAFIAVLVIHVDDVSGIALPVRLIVFMFPLGLVAGAYLYKWRRSYWLTKTVRLLVQNCVDVNQAFYFQGRPLFITAAYMKACVFAIYFVYFDATECVQNVDLLLFSCMEDEWGNLVKFIKFYTRDENYLSRMSMSERLTVMMSAPYLFKLVRQALPHPPQQRHVPHLLCLCQFTEECISRFVHGLDREDVPGLAELFTRHMPGKVSGSAVRRVQEELFHASHGLVP